MKTGRKGGAVEERAGQFPPCLTQSRTGGGEEQGEVVPASHTEKDPFPSLLSARTRKRGQRKSESICSLSGTALSQSLLSVGKEAPPECRRLLQSLNRRTARKNALMMK